eukprot:Skav208014  [mRNA]  locus=scaffold320:147822:150328:- [translate_table: standard]
MTASIRPVASTAPSVAPLSRCLTDMKLLRGPGGKGCGDGWLNQPSSDPARCGARAAILQVVQRGEGGMRQQSTMADRLYAQSAPVQRLDYFISHCWSDGRSGKLFALWIHSGLDFGNLTAAMCIATPGVPPRVATTCTVLCRARLLPVVVLPELGFEFFPWALLLGDPGDGGWTSGWMWMVDGFLVMDDTWH